MRPLSGTGEAVITEWKDAGLLKPSVVKPLLATVAKSLAFRRLGSLKPTDLVALRNVLRTILGN